VLAALDATYLVDSHPSGIAVYSRELVDGLASEHPDDRYLHYYRLKQYRRAPAPAFPNVQNQLLLPVVGALRGGTQIFHALNQRIDRRIAPKVVSTFHDLSVMTGEYSSDDFRKRFSEQARRAAQRSDLIITVSDFTRRQVEACLNVPTARIRVVPHGVHPPPVVPPLSNREQIILCVGALQLRKNVTRLVKAFEMLPGETRNGWKLILAGSTAGFGAAQILSHIEQSPVASQIQIRGYVSAADLVDLYNRALLFAFPSLDEGFGMPVLEAMAHGLPVLTSNCSALPEVAGDAALLVDAEDTAAIAGALERLTKDEDLRIDLAKRGRERALIRPWRGAVESTYRVYRELAG
jgi:glycosyltransferase involved in cell wall biosynthesis